MRDRTIVNLTSQGGEKGFIGLKYFFTPGCQHFLEFTFAAVWIFFVVNFPFMVEIVHCGGKRFELLAWLWLFLDHPGNFRAHPGVEF